MVLDSRSLEGGETRPSILGSTQTDWSTFSCTHASGARILRVRGSVRNRVARAKLFKNSSVNLVAALPMGESPSEISEKLRVGVAGEADAGRSEEVSPARGFGVDAAHRADLRACGVKVVRLALYCDQKTEIYRDSFRIESINPMAGENLSPAICFGEKWAPRFSKMKNRNFGKISLANFRIGGNVRAFHESL